MLLHFSYKFPRQHSKHIHSTHLPYPESFVPGRISSCLPFQAHPLRSGFIGRLRAVLRYVSFSHANIETTGTVTFSQTDCIDTFFIH